MQRQSMQRCVRGGLGSAIVGLAVLLGGCSHNPLAPDPVAAGAADEEINVYPANYKPDILGAMHAYLNDPTGIRDAGIAEPALKSVGGNTRYVVCVRFNAKKKGNVYAGVKEIAAVFLAGRFDRFAETGREGGRETGREEHSACTGATYAPFPELQKLSG
jgi:hypothetical protein